MRHEFADGKYTVINDNGKLTALRHGEPWGRDLVGDNLVYWMLIEVDTLRAVNQELLEACQTLVGLPNTEDWIATLRLAVDQARAAIAKAEGQA
jgi:hypothetical protein